MLGNLQNRSICEKSRAAVQSHLRHSVLLFCWQKRCHATFVDHWRQSARNHGSHRQYNDICLSCLHVWPVVLSDISPLNAVDDLYVPALHRACPHPLLLLSNMSYTTVYT